MSGGFRHILFHFKGNLAVIFPLCVMFKDIEKICLTKVMVAIELKFIFKSRYNNVVVVVVGGDCVAKCET